MKTAEFIKKYKAWEDGSEWAMSVSDDMADVWDALIKEGRRDWLLRVAILPGIFTKAQMTLLSCRFIREVPLQDGRKVWDLLTDPISRKAVETAERFVRGEVTKEELNTAYEAARYVARSAYATSYAASRDASDAARYVARSAYAASRDASRDASDAADVAYASCEAADAAAYAASAAYSDTAYTVSIFVAWAANAAVNAAACTAYGPCDTNYVVATFVAGATKATAYHIVRAAAETAQVRLIAELPNPFK